MNIRYSNEFVSKADVIMLITEKIDKYVNNLDSGRTANECLECSRILREAVENMEALQLSFTSTRHSICKPLSEYDINDYFGKE